MKKLIPFIIMGLLLAAQVLAQQQSDIWVISLNYNAGKLSIGNIKDAFTTSSYNVYADSAYKVLVIASDNRILGDVKFLTPNDFRDSSGRFNVFAPRSGDDATIKIFDIAGQEILSSRVPNVSPKTQRAQSTRPIYGIDFGYNPRIWLILGPLALIIGFLVSVEVKRRKDHARLMVRQRGQKADALRDYIASNLKKGFGKEQIRNALYKNGYDSGEIDEAFKGMK